MADGYRLARPVAQKLEELYNANEDRTALIPDGSTIAIKKYENRLLSYSAQQLVESDGLSKGWYLAAADYPKDSREMPYMFISSEGRHWSVAQEPVPEWTYPILENFVQIEEISPEIIDPSL